jgi:hypothetical protein
MGFRLKGMIDTHTKYHVAGSHKCLQFCLPPTFKITLYRKNVGSLFQGQVMSSMLAKVQQLIYGQQAVAPVFIHAFWH